MVRLFRSPPEAGVRFSRVPAALSPGLPASLLLHLGLEPVAGDAEGLFVGVEVVVGAAGVVDVVDFEWAVGVSAVDAAVSVAFEDAEPGGGGVVPSVSPGHRIRPGVRADSPWAGCRRVRGRRGWGGR